jgi:arsenate reductase
MKPTILCYPKCGTCRKAEKWLKENNIEYIYRDIKETNPLREELSSWINQSDYPVSKFFNTSGLLYKEQNMKDKVKTLSESELIDILSSNGLLVKRPLLIHGDKVLVGFNEKVWQHHFGL